MGVTRVGSDIHVNTSLAGEQQIAGTAYLAGGGVVVIWNDGPNPGDAQGKGVRGQMFSADGQPAGSEFVVNTTLQGDQSDAQVTALTGGRFVVVWKDASGQGGDAELTGVKLQVFGADGTKVDGEVLVNTAVAGNQAAPQVAALANGGFVVIWTDLSGGVGGAGGDSSSEAIKGQRFNSDGDPLGTEFRVNTTTPDGQFAPDVTALSGGGFAVSWSDASKTDGDSDWGVRAQVYNAAGQASGGELHVNTQKVGFQVEPEIYGLSNGALVVVWTDWDPAGDGSSYSIKAQVIGANGAKVGGEIAVNTATAGYQADPAAVALAGGGFAVAWSDNSLGVGGATGDSSNSAVKAQVFDNSGAKVGSEILVNTTVQGFQNKPSITATSDGGFAVGWSDSSQATMQMFAAAGTRIGGELRLSGSPGTQSDVGLLGLDDDQVFAVWRRYDEVGVTGYNIDAQVTMIAPVVTAVQVPGDGVHGTGDVLTFKVTFDEAITVSGGTPRLALDVGGVTRYATLTGGSGTTQLEFKYTVVAADNDADGIAISGLQANGATLTASGGDAAALTLNGVPSLDDVVVQGNAPPTLGGLTGTASFTEGADPVKVASSLTVTDPEGDELHSATVSITGGLKAAEDKLDLVTDDGMGDIEKNYDSTTGVLTLTSAGGVTEAQMQAALRAVTYSNSSQAPDTGIRTINVVVNDGQANSSPGTRVLTVTGVNDAPAGADKTITINEDAPRALTAADFGLTDTDGNTLASVKIVTSPLSGLQYNGAGIDSGSNISLADINAGKLIYTPPADASGTGLASFTFKVQDNGGTANGGVDLDPSANTITFDVTAVNDAPVIAHSGLVSAFAEGSAPVSVSPNATVSDVDSASLTSATVSITNNFQAGYDTLGFTNAAGMSEIAGDYNASTGVLTLSDTDGATPAEWQAALRAVTFSNSSDTLGSTTRQVSFTASDGTTTSAAAARGLSTAGQNDAPSGADKTVLMGEDTQYTVSASDLGFTDIDGNTLAAVKITTVPTAGVLYYDGNPVTAGEVTLVGPGHHLVYEPAHDGWGEGYASFTFQVQDSGNTSNGGVNLDPTPNTITFDVDWASDPTVLGGGGTTGAFTVGGGAVPVGPDLTVTDPDGAGQTAASVKITGGFQPGDKLQLTVTPEMGELSPEYDPATGILTISTSEEGVTVAQMQAALRGVTYVSTSGSPDLSPRTFTISVFDDAYSNDVTSTVTVSPAPPPPPSTPTGPVVDGVPVTTTTTTGSDGTATQTVTIPVVTTTRTDTVGGNNLADIPLVSGGGTAPAVLSAQVPAGYGLTVSGPAAPQTAGTSLTDLIREIQAHTTTGSADQTSLTGGGSGFLGSLTASTPLLVQTIVPTGGGPGAAPLVINGAAPSAGDAAVALVIDTRSLPSGSSIQLNNVEFAAVIGAVTVTGGAGSQTVFGDGASQNLFLGADDDELHGGGGTDTVASAGGNDRLFGDEGSDSVSGGIGDDYVHGNAGNDTVSGGDGNDWAYGGKDDDQITGGSGNDLVVGDLGNDQLQGNTGADTLDGGLGHDTVHGGQDNDQVTGGDGNDAVLGDAGDDAVQGAAGNDTVSGGLGSDVLHGGQGDDWVYGDAGDDWLSGDKGTDTLVGGAGADTFHLNSLTGVDLVLDFNQLEGDRVLIDLDTPYAVAQLGQDVIVNIGVGNYMLLQNVQLSSLHEGWIVAG